MFDSLFCLLEQLISFKSTFFSAVYSSCLFLILILDNVGLVKVVEVEDDCCSCCWKIEFLYGRVGEMSPKISNPCIGDKGK